MGPLSPCLQKNWVKYCVTFEVSDVKILVTFLGKTFTPANNWKRLKGKNPEGKNFRKLLRRKPYSAKISKIFRNTTKSSKNDIFYLLRNLLKYLPRRCFLPRSFQKFLPFAFLPSGSFQNKALNISGRVSGINLEKISTNIRFKFRAIFAKTSFSRSAVMTLLQITLYRAVPSAGLSCC